MNKKKKCKPGGNCCKKCKKNGLGWGNPDYYGAVPSDGGSVSGIGETVDILEDLLREYIKNSLTRR